MPREGWKGVNIPEELYEELERIVEKSLGEFTSVPELIRKVIADFLKIRKEVA